jgi:hypothetical protein
MLKTVLLKRLAIPACAKGLRVANWVLGVPQLSVWGEEVYATFRTMRKHRGLVATQDYFKAARWAVVKCLAGDPLPAGTAGVRMDRKGLPTCLPKGIRMMLRVTPDRTTQAVALFLLSIYLCFTGKRAVSYANITDQCSVSLDSIAGEFARSLVPLLHSLGVRDPLRLGTVRFHITNRGGPNGHALLCAHLDAAAVLATDVGGWLRKWTLAIYPRSGPDFVKNLDRVGAIALELGLVGSRQLSVGKIGLKTEPVKNRIFAISDYYTQASLRPLHHALMDLLRGIPMDATWNQDQGSRQVQKWCAEGKELWSFDLSAATDRFPRRLQSTLISHLLRNYGTGLGDTWASLLCDRGYRIPRSSTTVRYEVGQPMGSYSSWAAFTLTHHLMVQWAAYRIGRKGRCFREYVILGDDIVIAEGRVAAEYQSLMSALGVNINLNKSLRAKGSAEFAKRTFVGTWEITGLLWSQFNQAGNSPFGLFQLLSELKRRDFAVSLAGCVVAALGKPSTRKVGGGLRCLLLALSEPGGPLEHMGVWWASVTSDTVADYHSAFNRGTLAVDSCIRTAQDSARWAIARQLSAGRAIAPLLRGASDFEALRASLPSLLGNQVLSSSKIVPTDLRNSEVRRLLESHPAGAITNEQLQEELGLYKKVQRLRILSRADKEYLTQARTHFGGAADRAMLVSFAYVG